MHAFDGIWTRNPSKRAATDLLVTARPPGSARIVSFPCRNQSNDSRSSRPYTNSTAYTTWLHWLAYILYKIKVCSSVFSYSIFASSYLIAEYSGRYASTTITFYGRHPTWRFNTGYFLKEIMRHKQLPLNLILFQSYQVSAFMKPLWLCRAHFVLGYEQPDDGFIKAETWLLWKKKIKLRGSWLWLIISLRKYPLLLLSKKSPFRYQRGLVHTVILSGLVSSYKWGCLVRSCMNF
jgi:hypothetical protein